MITCQDAVRAGQVAGAYFAILRLGALRRALLDLAGTREPAALALDEQSRGQFCGPYQSWEVRP